MKKTNRALALLLAMLMIVSALLGTLTACQDPETPGTNPGGNGDKPGGGGSPAGPGAEYDGTYSLTVMSAGGMPFASLPVYCFEYADGAIGDICDVQMTDSNGKVQFELDNPTDYAVTIIDDVPKGYKANEFYPLVGSKMEIKVESSLIMEDITEADKQSLGLGDVMYDFAFTNADGKTVKLSDELKTHDMVLLNFWYVNCSACQLEFPYMQASYENYKDDVSILALSPIDERLDISNFQVNNGLTFEMGKDVNYEILNAFFDPVTMAYPSSIIIDRYGVITMIEIGALTSERQFNIIFDYFTGDDYKQSLVSSIEDITPIVEPDVEQPSSSKVNQIMGSSDLDVNYTPDDAKYSWPFIEGTKDGAPCLVPGNGGKNLPDSYSIIYATLELEAGQAIAFDYFLSTEFGADYLHLIVDGKNIFALSGISDKWQTCFYVAEEAGEYELAISYIKDGTEDAGDDTVYLRNFRTVEEITSPTYVFRYAAKNPNFANIYQDYITPVFNEEDGYYHVNSVDGPILLADLMGYTRFTNETNIYYLIGDLLASKNISEEEYNRLIDYCSYASNASLNGLCSVTRELATLLEKVAKMSKYDDNWLQMCCYYDAYGTNGEQHEDPIRGLAIFNAYPVIEGGVEVGDNTPVEDAFPNVIDYQRLIMPRGLLYKFTPEVSGTYRISSYSEYEVNAWIFTAAGLHDREEWFTYENVYRGTDVQATDNNCYMIAYLEAGVDYYIDIAFYDVYQFGKIYFRVERLTSQDNLYPNGEGYYRFSSASPGYFTYYENEEEGSVNTNKIVAGGIDVVFNSTTKYWYEKRTDNRQGSFLYADFTLTTGIFTRNTIEKMIDANAFDFSKSEEDQYVLNVLAEFDGDEEKCVQYLRENWGEDFDEFYNEVYLVEEVFKGTYHGKGANYTDTMRGYLAKKITVGYNSILGETIKEGDARIGCVIVDEQLANILQLLMDKYTFAGVENSWTKLCYYSQYFCAATPK